MVPGARIEGVLTGSNGRPASKYKVIGEISEPQPGERQAEVNTDGEFNFQNCRAGGYRLKVAVATDDQERYYFYYPGTYDQELARTFTVSPGDVFDLSDWSLPFPLIRRHIAGYVYLPGGGPAVGATVRIVNQTHQVGRTWTDLSGHFTLEVTMPDAPLVIVAVLHARNGGPREMFFFEKKFDGLPALDEGLVLRLQKE